jgi:hypothetical protein
MSLQSRITALIGAIKADLTALTGRVTTLEGAGGGGGGAVVSCAHVRNTDSTTDLNSNNSWTTAPLTGTVDFLDAAAFEVSGSGIKCLADGLYELDTSIYSLPANTSRALSISFAVNGTPFGARTVTNRAQNNNAYVSGILGELVTLSENDIVTVVTTKNHGYGGMTMFAGRCRFSVKKIQ